MNKHLIGVAALALLIPYGPVSAADLGGNCCADLEERVAELEATTARKGNRKVSLTIYGHVHEAIMFHDLDDAPRDTVSLIPGTQSVSRFGMRGSSKLTTEWEAGFVIEVGVGGFEANRFGTARDLGLDVRKSSLFVKSAVLGIVTLGRDSMATDGVAEIDLSRSGIASTGLSLAPYDKALTGQALDPFDGYRADMVRWTSPTLAGFQISGAFATENQYDVALRYAGEFSSVRLAGGIGYRYDSFQAGPAIFAGDPTLEGTKTIVGSASIMEVTSGLFLSGSYGDVDLAGTTTDVRGWAIRGGIERPIAAGTTATGFIEYGQVDVDDLDGDMFGGGLVVSTGPFAWYLTGRHIKAEGEDANVGLMGVKIQF